MKKRYETDGSSIIDTGKRRGRKRVRPTVDDVTPQTSSATNTPVNYVSYQDEILDAVSRIQTMKSDNHN